MKYICDKCIHIGACLVPSNLGYVEQCKHFKEKPKHIHELTNEEWIQSATTEQLAEALLNIMANNEFTLYLIHTEKRSVQEIKGAVVEWLKQPHKGE